MELGQHLFDAGILGSAELNEDGISPLVDILFNDEEYGSLTCQLHFCAKFQKS